jgi:hypothetical protein
MRRSIRPKQVSAPATTSPLTRAGRWSATGSVRDRHQYWAWIRILGDVEARPDLTITAVGWDVAGS